MVQITSLNYPFIPVILSERICQNGKDNLLHTAGLNPTVLGAHRQL